MPKSWPTPPGGVLDILVMFFIRYLSILRHPLSRKFRLISRIRLQARTTNNPSVSRLLAERLMTSHLIASHGHQLTAALPRLGKTVVNTLHTSCCVKVAGIAAFYRDVPHPIARGTTIVLVNLQYHAPSRFLRTAQVDDQFRISVLAHFRRIQVQAAAIIAAAFTHISAPTVCRRL